MGQQEHASRRRRTAAPLEAPRATPPRRSSGSPARRLTSGSSSRIRPTSRRRRLSGTRGNMAPSSMRWAAARASPTRRCSTRIRAAVLFTADVIAVDVAGKRALRWGGNWYMPMLIGQQTTPLVLQLAVAHVPVEATDPERADALPCGPGDHLRLFPRLQRTEHDVGHGPGPAPPGPGLPYGRLVQRQGAVPPGHHPLRPLAQGQGRGPGTLGRRLAAQDGLSADRRLAGQRALVRQPLLAHEQRVHHPPEHRAGRRDLRDPLRPGPASGD